MKRNVAILLFVGMLLGLLFLTPSQAVQAQDPTPTPERLLDDAPPGEPAFPVTDRAIPYWIHNCPVSQATTVLVDAKLEELNKSRKTQTVILCMPYGEVRDGVIYAISFYNYMQLGYPDIAFRDRGFVWLVNVDETHMKINYAVGEGLPKLDAGEIDTMRNNATDVYLTSGSLDDSLLGLAQSYADAVNTQYPEVSVATQPVSNEPSQVQSGNAGDSLVLLLTCLCLGILLIVIAILLYLSGGLNGSGGNNDDDDDDGDNDGNDGGHFTPTYYPPTHNSQHPQSTHHPSSTPTHHPSPPSPRPPSTPRPRTGGGGGPARRGG